MSSTQAAATATASQPPAIRVPYGRTVHGEEEIAAVVEVLRTSTQMGANVRKMEASVAALFAKQHGVMVNSGSSANYLAIELLGLRGGAEVITPALTFATTVAPIVKNGLVPAFVDVEPNTFNIDAEQVEAMIGPNTRAMMVPSLIGWPRSPPSTNYWLSRIPPTRWARRYAARAPEPDRTSARPVSTARTSSTAPATAECCASMTPPWRTRRGCCAAGAEARRCSSIRRTRRNALA